MLEETPTTIGQRIWRGLIGLFLGILVLMLIITFLPGDMEESFMNTITGKISTTAGHVGNTPIPIDYFNAARKDCYYRYKEYAPQLATSDDMISNCAFQTLRSVMVGKELAAAFGYQVSQLAVKRELSRQAREYQQQAGDQAGYDEEDLRSVEDIYRNLLRSEPILYRVDTTTSMTLFNSFLHSELKKTESELALENEAKGVRVSLRLVAFTNSDLMEKVESELNITDEMIRTEYDKETKAGTTPKGEDGKPLSFEARKAILTSKIRLDRKSKGLEEKKAELKAIREKGASLEEIAADLSMRPISLQNLTIQDLSSLNYQGQIFRLSQDQGFLKDMSERGFGDKKVGGPYQDGDKNFFVEFTGVTLGSPSVAKQTQAGTEDSTALLSGFFMEMNQSIGKDKPLLRNIRLAGEE